jgi:hypothetical protein
VGSIGEFPLQPAAAKVTMNGRYANRDFKLN